LEEANDTIKNKFSEYLNYTFVKTTLSNNKFTVLGEVKTPGTQKIIGENITIFEALGLAGDLTDFGNRENVRILRKINNETKVYVVDVSKTELISSNAYYILPNDIIYVEPMKVKLFKLNASSISLILSSVSIILILIIRSKSL
jgi:polysaccharide export outer membrane protein